MSRKTNDHIPGHKNHPPAKQIRMKYGVPAWYKVEEQLTPKESALPNWLVHEYPADKYEHEGGTTGLCIGGKRAGKTTFGLWTATRCMEINNEAVIWRGSPTRSEWLPLKYWTRLMLPASVRHEAYWDPLEFNHEAEHADLEDVVKEVVYYDDVRDLLEKLEPGEFHVVYPDPEFRGCNEVMRESEYCPHEVEYTPHFVRDDAESAPTKLVTWWVAFIIARVEYGPYHFMQLIFDETADLAPDSARADKDYMYEMVVALRAATADVDKYLFSILWLAHHEENLHDKARRPVQWRIDMPDGSPNPCTSNGDSPPVGFKNIPMKFDMMGNLPKGCGKALVWSEGGFTRLSYENFPDADEDQRRKLKIKFVAGRSVADTRELRARGSESAGQPRGVTE